MKIKTFTDAYKEFQRLVSEREQLALVLSELTNQLGRPVKSFEDLVSLFHCSYILPDGRFCYVTVNAGVMINKSKGIYTMITVGSKEIVSIARGEEPDTYIVSTDISFLL